MYTKHNLFFDLQIKGYKYIYFNSECTAKGDSEEEGGGVIISISFPDI